ncbi:hypothetical protein NLX83_37940 [Allokutzneria sp. A3M-2-11 16]|uniref:hypothetical protein n=1 Tax=Allokutzneria sp. A3M-2-11 16 TaxID=2962043 RepID=UPI0020B702AD|nr:hypothetical protein [Allokutzneria sp. A3M-2-11 16]MCP3805064.1 hypothetical protein [Allokutzneria sp. A3M-2-11 16]
MPSIRIAVASLLAVISAAALAVGLRTWAVEEGVIGPARVSVHSQEPAPSRLMIKCFRADQ